MGKLNFTKMVGAGNDFIVIDARLKALGLKIQDHAKRLCERKTGIGADGILLLEKSKVADFRMRLFNTDASEAEMCGNGLRCAILYAGTHGCTRAPVHQSTSKRMKVETKAGIYEGEITAKEMVKVKMGPARDLRMNFPISVNGRDLKVNFITTGVPHTVIFVEDLDKIDVDSIGSAIRHHEEFKPKGTNVNFVEIIDDNNIRIRTFERGVEGETLACGTGSVAAAITSTVNSKGPRIKVNVHTRGGVLKIEFQKRMYKIKNIFMEGEAKAVFQGGIYV